MVDSLLNIFYAIGLLLVITICLNLFLMLLIALIKIIYCLIDTIKHPDKAIKWGDECDNDGAF